MKGVSCAACQEAKRNPLTGMFQAGCRACEARSLAGSPAAWRAMRGQSSDELRQAIERTWPEWDYDAGRRMVWVWIKKMREARGQ